MSQLSTAITVVVLVCVLAASAHAQDKPRRPQRAEKVSFLAFGIGGYSCGKYMEARRKSLERELYSNWLAGFITAISWADNGAFPPARFDMDAGLAWIDNHCRQNPLDRFCEAAVYLANHLILTGDSK
jgi:hypothetical protein